MAVEHAGEYLLQVRDLSVTYSSTHGKVLRALDRLGVQIRGGEILGVLGESGCGKSTLANALLRLLPEHATCEAGAILFCGRDLLQLHKSDLRAIRGKEISLVPQDPALALNPVMTVGTQIAEVLRAHLQLSQQERRARVNELLQDVGFDKAETIYDFYPHQLSGGQRQRIVIAQAVACRPALVIADEPTSKLDACLRNEIMSLLAGIRERCGTTIVVISHDPTLFAGFADRLAVMYAGQIVEVGPTSQIFRQPLHPYTRALVQLANTPLVGGERSSGRFAVIPGEPPDSCSVRIGCQFEPRCSERMELCTTTQPREIRLETSRLVTCFQHDK